MWTAQPYGFREDVRQVIRVRLASIDVPRMGTRAPGCAASPGGFAVLDLVYLAVTIALFAIVGVIAKAVEKL